MRFELRYVSKYICSEVSIKLVKHASLLFLDFDVTITVELVTHWSMSCRWSLEIQPAIDREFTF